MSNVEYEKKKSWTALLRARRMATRKLEVWGCLDVPFGSGKLYTPIEHPSGDAKGHLSVSVG